MNRYGEKVRAGAKENGMVWAGWRKAPAGEGRGNAGPKYGMGQQAKENACPCYAGRRFGGRAVERRGTYFCSRLRRKRFISRTPKPLAPFG